MEMTEEVLMFKIGLNWIVGLLACVFLLVVLSSSTSATEADSLPPGNAEQGAKIYNLTCMACHGDQAQGNIIFNAPKLVGQEPWYIERQLKNFASGVRGADPRDLFGAQMRPMAMTLQGDQAIADVIAYIGSLGEPAK